MILRLAKHGEHVRFVWNMYLIKLVPRTSLDAASSYLRPMVSNELQEAGRPGRTNLSVSDLATMDGLEFLHVISGCNPKATRALRLVYADFLRV